MEIFLFISLLISINAKYITVPISYYKNTFMTIPICVGTPQQCFDVILDTGSARLWLNEGQLVNEDKSKPLYNRRQSSTYRTINDYVELTYLTSSAFTIEGSDIVSIGDVKIEKFPFYLSEGGFGYTERNGIFGFGYPNEKDKDCLHFSAIEHLKKSNVIKERIFSIEIDNDMNKGVMKIGKFPSEKVKKIENFGFCYNPMKVDTLTNGLWSCKLNSIYFNNVIDYVKVETNFSASEDKNKEVYVDIDTGTNMFLVAFDMLNNIYEKYINILYGNTCNLNIIDKLYYHIECNKYFDINRISDMYIKLGNFTMKLDRSMLFTKKNESNVISYEFILKTHFSFDYWRMSQDILRNFLIVFDADKSITGFYSESNIFKESSEYDYYIQSYFHQSSEIIFYCLCIVILICTISIVFLLLSYSYK